MTETDSMYQEKKEEENSWELRIVSMQQLNENENEKIDKYLNLSWEQK